MIEVLLCSVVTILPDFLYRRFAQGKRLGREITLYSIWYELRYGITACLGLTIVLLTLILYFHPSTSSAVSFYRTVPILPEGSGRVEEVYVELQHQVKAGDPIFKLDSSRQEAALLTAQKRVAETQAAFEVAKTELAGADAKIQEAESAYQQAVDELATKTELQKRNAGTVAERELERLQNVVNGRQASVAATIASKQSVQAQIASLLPAQKASAEAALAEAQVELDKTVVRAGIDGRLEQFTLRKGDIVNPIMRSAGVLIPAEAGRAGLVAGFSQLEAQVMKRGMVAEVTCISKPLAIIPMVVTSVQDRAGAGVGQADRCPAGGEARHDHRLSGAALRWRLRRRAAGQQLHRQRLHQQSRQAGRPGDGHRAVAVPACHRHGRRRARDHPEDPGAAAAGKDAGAVRRALRGKSTSA